MGAPIQRDVVVAGAGPAGVAAAVALVRRDAALAGRVICFDRARFPRAKPCGGGLTGHAKAALRSLGLALRVPRASAHTGRLVYGDIERDVPLPEPVDVVRREEFDADLVAQGREAGVEIVEGEGVAAFRVDEAAGTVDVDTTAGRAFRARVLVGADGAASRVRAAVRARSPRVDGRPHVEGTPLRLFRLEIPAPAAADLDGRMVYDFSGMAEGLRGYVWIFPVPGGRLNVGVMHVPSRQLSGAAIERVLERVLARHRIALPGPARGWPAWSYDPAAAVAAAHLLLVGDAAGIDTLTGEGIAVGLEHGPIAAEAIVTAFHAGDFRFRGYREAIRCATVGRELAVDHLLASLLYAPTAFRPWLSLVMLDRRVQSLYAARVSGGSVLADRKLDLCVALARHILHAPARWRRIVEALPRVHGAQPAGPPTAE